VKLNPRVKRMSGHGGITDRMDCQIIMSVFVAVYRTTFFLRNKHATVAQILSQVRDAILSVPVCARFWERLILLQCHPRFNWIVHQTQVDSLSVDDKRELLSRLQAAVS